jgi:hypothetical protein
MKRTPVHKDDASGIKQLQARHNESSLSTSVLAVVITCALLGLLVLCAVGMCAYLVHHQRQSPPMISRPVSTELTVVRRKGVVSTDCAWCYISEARLCKWCSGEVDGEMEEYKGEKMLVDEWAAGEHGWRSVLGSSQSRKTGSRSESRSESRATGKINKDFSAERWGVGSDSVVGVMGSENNEGLNGNRDGVIQGDSAEKCGGGPGSVVITRGTEISESKNRSRGHGVIMKGAMAERWGGNPESVVVVENTGASERMGRNKSGSRGRSGSGALPKQSFRPDAGGIYEIPTMDSVADSLPQLPPRAARREL